MKRKWLVIVHIAMCAIILSACGGNVEAERTLEQTKKAVSGEQISAFNDALPFLAAPEFTLDEEGSVRIEMIIQSNDVSFFGNRIYDALQAAENVFDDYSISMVFSSIDEILFVFDGDMDFALLTDFRTQESKLTVLHSVEELANIFPALTEHINLSRLDQDDVAIYVEVMKVMDERSADSEDAILNELSSNYGMTSQQLKVFLVDMMTKVYSHSHSFQVITPIIYPSYTESVRFPIFDDVPDIVFSTFASENGLEDKIYSVVGTVRKTDYFSMDSGELSYFIIDTDRGPILFYDLYTYALSQFDNTDDLYVEYNSDYAFPDVGVTVKVYGVYQGYSDVFGMPSFIYGIPKWFEG